MKAVGYKKSLPIDDAEALFDFETSKPEPKGRDIRVAVKAISANPVDYKVRKRAAPPEGETKISASMPPASSMRSAPRSSLFKPGDEVFYAGSIQRQGTNSRISSGRRAHRRRQAEDAVVCASRGVAADLDHRLGAAVRSAGRGARQERRCAHAADHRRRRRGRLDPDPARPPAHRSDGGRHRDPSGVAKMVPRSRRACGDRPRQADEGADREAEAAAGGLVASLTFTDQHYKAIAEFMAPQGKFGLIDDPPSSTSPSSRARRSRSTGNRCSRARRSRRPT